MHAGVNTHARTGVCTHTLTAPTPLSHRHTHIQAQMRALAHTHVGLHTLSQCTHTHTHSKSHMSTRTHAHPGLLPPGTTLKPRPRARRHRPTCTHSALRACSLHTAGALLPPHQPHSAQETPPGTPRSPRPGQSPQTSHKVLSSGPHAAQDVLVPRGQGGGDQQQLT